MAEIAQLRSEMTKYIGVLQGWPWIRITDPLQCVTYSTLARSPIGGVCQSIIGQKNREKESDKRCDFFLFFLTPFFSLSFFFPFLVFQINYCTPPKNRARKRRNEAFIVDMAGESASQQGNRMSNNKQLATTTGVKEEKRAEQGLPWLGSFQISSCLPMARALVMSTTGMRRLATSFGDRY